MEAVKFSKRPRLKNPYLIAAWPGMGEVAFKSAMYLVDKLKAVEFAQLPPEAYFYLTSGLINEGIISLPPLPQNKFFYWKNKNGINDLIIFVSNAQPDLAKAAEYSRQIIEFAKFMHVQMIASIAAMPQAIDHMQDAKVWSASTTPAISNELKKYGLNTMTQGQISGMNGLFLAAAKKEGLKGFCLLGEIPLYTIHIENPKAVLAVLKSLSKILNIRLDFNELSEQAQAMEGEVNKLLDFLKLGTQKEGPIGEEEIEKIRKTLSQLTKLPVSVKDKIEKLFQEVSGDISRAQELKHELDKWNVYKEYEDRFLDLFKKKKDRNN